MRHFAKHSRTARVGGFTLVEILTALFILVIGISGTLSIVMRSTQMGAAATDRNNASILIPEAIDEIKHALLITPADIATYGIDPSHTGEYMDTVNLTNGSFADPNPFAKISCFPNYRLPSPQPAQPAIASLSDITYPKALTRTDLITGGDLSLVYWPMTTGGCRVVGQKLLTDATQRLGSSGNTYRALFKIEPHPEWISNPYTRAATRENLNSAFVGVYVLTLTMYRDLNPEMSTTLVPDFARPSQTIKKLQQISDPVVVFLHDSKVR